MDVKIALEHVAFSCYRSRALILREVLILWYRESLSGDAFFPNRNMVASCLGRVVDILEASGAFDPGSNPGRGVLSFKSKSLSHYHFEFL